MHELEKLFLHISLPLNFRKLNPSKISHYMVVRSRQLILLSGRDFDITIEI